MDIENAKNYIIAGFIALVMVLTNPKLDDHQAEFSLYLEQFGTNATSQNIWDELGSTIGSKLFSKFISIDNFILFSLTEFRYQGNSKYIGIGILGNVFLFNNLINSSASTTSSNYKFDDTNYGLDPKKVEYYVDGSPRIIDVVLVGIDGAIMTYENVDLPFKYELYADKGEILSIETRLNDIWFDPEYPVPYQVFIYVNNKLLKNKNSNGERSVNISTTCP